MMKNLKSKLILLSLIGTLACTKEELCKTLYLADMICSKLALAVPTVETGVAFALTTIIKNVAESTNFCETKTAPNSSTQLNVDYRSDENSPWEPSQFNNQGTLVYDVFAPTESLPPNDSTGINPEFRMSVPGQYRFSSTADGQYDVEERNETNNGGPQPSGTLNGRAAGSANYVIVTVVPSKDYVPQPLAPGQVPTVEYLGLKK